jgi:hypothetical protein
MLDLIQDVQITGFAPLVVKAKETLAELDSALLRCLRDHETRLHILSPLERFTDVNPAYKATGDDSCLLGLFDRSKNHIILRRVDGLTQAHEIFHLVDAFLGECGRFRSQDDPAINRAYARHRKDGLFLSAYSAYNVIEFGAELARSLLGFSGSATIAGKTDADRIRRIDPDAVRAVQSMIDDLRSRYRPPAAPPSCVSTAAP